MNSVRTPSACSCTTELVETPESPLLPASMRHHSTGAAAVIPALAAAGSMAAARLWGGHWRESLFQRRPRQGSGGCSAAGSQSPRPQAVSEAGIVQAAFLQLVRAQRALQGGSARVSDAVGLLQTPALAPGC